MSKSNEFIFIKNARVSFPHLFTKPIINGNEGKCGCTLMLDPETNATHIKAIQQEIDAITQDKFKGRKLPSDKICLRDGEDKGRPEYEGLMVISANSKDRPFVLGNNRKQITSEEECDIYSGCYVNAKIRLWAQNNNYGKRINAELIAIQFAGDGESLDGSYVSADVAAEGFEDTSEDDLDFLSQAS